MIKDCEVPYETLKKMQDTHECMCGARLSVAWGGMWGYKGYVLRCSANAEHSEFVRPFETSMANNPDMPGWRLSKYRRRQLEQQIGDKNAAAVMKYQGIMTLSQKDATDIIATIWPRAIKEAPAEVKRAMLICVQYRLNPLMKHLYLLPFKDKEESKKQGKEIFNWAVALGISANRLLARRQGPYSYFDNTPRIMTDDEQKIIFGKVDKHKLWAITKIKDKEGNEAQGYGWWPKKDDGTADVYGADKGNTPEGMAMIRSERQALDRLRPDSMPANVMVVDEKYMPEGSRVIDAEKIAPGESPKTITEGKQVIVEQSTEEKHDTEEHPSGGVDKDWLKETLKAIKWSDETTKSWIAANLKVDATGDLIKDVLPRLNKEQAQRFTNEIQNKASQLPLIS